jgi:hypothetical protein
MVQQLVLVFLLATSAVVYVTVFAREAVISRLTVDTVEVFSVGSCDPEEGEMLEPSKTDASDMDRTDFNMVFITGKSFIG